MDGKTLRTLIRVKGAAGQGVESVCETYEVTFMSVTRVADGRTTPTEATLRKLFSFVEKETGTRPPYFTFNGRRFLDPEQNAALAAERDHWQARAEQLQAQIAEAQAREWRLRIAHS